MDARGPRAHPVTVRPLLLGAAAMATLALVFAFRAASKMPDFEVYWRAGARAQVAEPLYRAADEHYQFKYLPAFAVLAIPLAAVPLGTAKPLWFIASALLIPALIAGSIGLLPNARRARWWLGLVTFLLMAKFYGHELVLGQVNLLFAVTVLTAVHLLLRGREMTAGLLLSLAIVIKPYAVLFLPWLAAQRRVPACAAAGAGLALALLVPAPLYGVGGTLALHQNWWQTVAGSTAPNLLNADNVSLAAMFAKWAGVGRAAGLLAAAGALALLVVAAAVFRMRGEVERPAGLEAALLLTLIPLLSPQGWDYVFLIATPAVVYLVHFQAVLPRPIRVVVWTALAVSAFSLYDVMGRAAYSRFMQLSVITLCYVVVTGALATLRWRHHA